MTAKLRLTIILGYIINGVYYHGDSSNSKKIIVKSSKVIFVLQLQTKETKTRK